MSLALPVIDAHVHFWDPRTTPRPTTAVGRVFRWNRRLLKTVGFRLFPRAARDFVGAPDHMIRAYLPGELAGEQSELDVRGVVHVQAGWHARGPLAAADETRWLTSLPGSRILAIVGQATLDSPELDRLLDAHRAASPKVVGVRDMTAHDPDRGVMDFSAPDRMSTAAFRGGLVRLGERGLSFDAWCYGPQLRALAAAADAAPATRIALCHLGTPVGAGGPFAGYGRTATERASIVARWKDDLARVASRPNVHAKLSGLTMPVLGFGFHHRAAPPSTTELADRIGPFVEHALAVFGPPRCFFASNFPVDKVAVTWPTLFSVYASLVSGLDHATRRGLFHDHAAGFYRVAGPRPSTTGDDPDVDGAARS